MQERQNDMEKMITNSKLEAIIVLTVLSILVTPKYIFADEHEWLKSPDFENLFVYTIFSSCTVGKEKLTKSLEGVMIRSRIKAFITEKQPSFWVISDKGKKDLYR